MTEEKYMVLYQSFVAGVWVSGIERHNDLGRAEETYQQLKEVEMHGTGHPMIRNVMLVERLK